MAFCTRAVMYTSVFEVYPLQESFYVHDRFVPLFGAFSSFCAVFPSGGSVPPLLSFREFADTLAQASRTKIG